MGRLDQQVILVTGGSRGIGAAIVEKSTREGARVAFCYRQSDENAREVQARSSSFGRDCRAYRYDISDEHQARELVAEVERDFGHIDGLVNNVGIMHSGPTLEEDLTNWNEVIRTNLSSAFVCTQAAIPGMLARGSGSVVMIASRLAQTGREQTAAYCASKAALLGLTKALAREFAPLGVRVNAVAPGVVLTDLAVASMKTDAGARTMSEFPLGRFAHPHEVAGTVVFLLSSDGMPFTGQTLNPNMGGFMP